MRAKRHFTDETHLDRFLQQYTQFLNEFIFRRVVFGLVGEFPIGIKFDLTTLPNERVRRRMFMNALISSERVRNILQTQVKINCFEIDFGLMRKRGKDGAEFGSEVKRSVLNGVI